MVAEIKREIQTPRGKLILLLTICLFVFIGWVTMKTATSAESVTDIREITFEIRGMAFGDDNPTIQIRPRETVRFTIHNLHPGMKHNFAIVGTDIRTRLLSYNEKESILFRRTAEGEWVYQCDPHAAQMNGRLIVR